MPNSFRMDGDAGVVHRTLSGDMTADELLESYASMPDHPDFRPGMKALTDMRKVTPRAFRLDLLRVARFVLEHAEEIGGLQIAVLVCSDAEYGLMRELNAELTAWPVHTEIRRDETEARKWLGLDAP